MKTIFSFLFVLIVAFTAFGQKSSDQTGGTIIITTQNDAPSFVGRIVDAEGRGISGALTITTGIEGNPNSIYRRTNAFGYFRIIDLPSGSYALTIKVKRRVSGVRFQGVNESPKITFVPNKL